MINMNELKKGDRIKIKSWEQMEQEYGVDEDGDIYTPVAFVRSMSEYCGKIMTVKNVIGTNTETCALVYGNDFVYCAEMIAGINPDEERTGFDYQKLASRTINTSLTANELVSHALHGMVGEIGEIHSLYQKVYQGHKMDVEHLKKEVGDLMWFVAEFCTANNWNLEDVMKLNIDKLKSRFPEGFEAEKSLNRKEGDL